MIAARPADLDSNAEPEAVLRWAYESFDRVAIVASLQAESSVIIDIASKIHRDLRILTLDTGRLPRETYEMIDRVRVRYGIEIEVLTPDPLEVEEMVATNGANLFFNSVQHRRHCCAVRKSHPLARALQGFGAWITGVRRDQAATRAHTQLAALDPQHEGLVKIAPLAAWSKAQVWDYIRSNDLPYHSLYDRGYTSIGCAPCTRPTVAGEDERAGRWWWELTEVKECGLHWTEERGA
jgi:phosphoadenosine phosphosulfate reductase